jgi:hypothetical protein
MTTTTIRPELTAMPQRIAALPIDARGYPVPWFVDYVDGQPEFRAMDPVKWKRAIKERLCWVCGQKLGAHLCFVLGPMCAITRTTTEPPCHLECARWSAVNCPFLARPHARRREDELMAAGKSIGGLPIKRNPGVAALWITRSYDRWSPAKGQILITVGDPERVEWYAEGRTATRDECLESIRTGLPFLEAEAEQQPGAMAELRKQQTRAEQYLPT